MLCCCGKSCIKFKIASDFEIGHIMSHARTNLKDWRSNKRRKKREGEREKSWLGKNKNKVSFLLNFFFHFLKIFDKISRNGLSVSQLQKWLWTIFYWSLTKSVVMETLKRKKNLVYNRLVMNISFYKTVTNNHFPPVTPNARLDCHSIMLSHHHAWCLAYPITVTKSHYNVKPWQCHAVVSSHLNTIIASHIIAWSHKVKLSHYYMLVKPNYYTISLSCRTMLSFHCHSI